jgi:hypothetical protein
VCSTLDVDRLAEVQHYIDAGAVPACWP